MDHNQLDQETRLEVVRRGLIDPHFFCKFFLETWFPLPMPWIHRGILAILTRRCEFLLNFDEHYGIRELKKIIAHFSWKDDPNNSESQEHAIFSLSEKDGALSISMTLGKHTLIMLPRGLSKTTLANAVNIWYALYQECPVFAYISEAQTHASQQLTNVAHQLTGNPKILAIFGSVKPEERSGKRWSESEGFIQTNTDVSFIARGRGSQIRGANIDAVRPHRILVDDVEDKESVKTFEQRQKTKEWFFGDVLPALPKLVEDVSVTALGTLLGPETLLTVLSRDPSWTVVVFGAVDKDGEPLWENWMSLEKLELEKQSYASKGLLHIYYLEYFNTVRNAENQKFKVEYIIHEPISMEDAPHRAIAIDPAITKRKKGCPTAIAVVGMRKNGIIQVLDYWQKLGATPREQVDQYFAMKVKWKTTKQGVESAAYQAALIHLLQEEMFRKGKELGPGAYFEITPITHSSTDQKESRVEGILQPRYASGYVRHQRRFVELETQLQDWPNGLKDGPDVLAMGVSLLDDFAAVAAGDESAQKDQYPPLDELFGGEWRVY
jgi:hypothetical protein